MELPIKLISTDFDGTIYAEFETPPIPPELCELIAGLQSRGAKWVINTGRDMSSLMESLGRARIPIRPDYLVLVEREIYQRNGTRFESVTHWNNACTRDHEALFARVREDVAALASWVNSRFRASVYDDPHSPLCIIAATNGDMDTIHARLEDYARTIPQLTVVRNDVYARFSHAGYNKGAALAEITKMTALHRDHVFAVGDHLNDLPMLREEFARFIATTANAVPEVRAAVEQAKGYISPRLHGYGVADALCYFGQNSRGNTPAA